MNTDQSIRLAIVEYYPIYRRGLLDCITEYEYFNVSIAVDSGAELMRQISTADTLPDICIISMCTPLFDGYNTLSLLKDKWPKLKILVLCDIIGDYLIAYIINKGINGVLLRSSNSDKICTAIFSIYHHNMYFGTANDLQNLKKTAALFSSCLSLTEREIEVIKLVSLGYSNKYISIKLNVSPRTIQTHCANICLKLHIHSREQIIVYAKSNALG